MTTKRKDYGEIYLKNKETTKQKIYSLFPLENEFENQSGQCMQLARLSAIAFLQSSSFFDYAEKLSGIQKKAKNLVGSMLTANKNDLFERYKHDHEILRGQDFPKKVMKEAANLDEGRKVVFILVIGNHSTSLVLENKNGNIYIGFYDPTFGQLYLQVTNKTEISKAMQDIYPYFNHSKSILNENNSLLGRIALFQDSIFDMSLPIVFVTRIINLSIDPYKGQKNQIDFSRNLEKNEALEYISENMGMLINMRSASSESVFIDFLTKYGREIKAKYAKFNACMTNIAKINEYFANILYLPLSVQFRMSLSTSLQEKKEDIDSNIISYESSKICLKENHNNKSLLKAEQKFAKINYEDKKEIFTRIGKCIANDDYKDSMKESIYYQRRDGVFLNLRDKYYEVKDQASSKKEISKEICLDINSILELSGDVSSEL